MSYLVGEGRANEHSNPHIVAGDADLLMTWGGRELSHEDALVMANELDESRRLMGTEVTVLKRTVDAGSGVLLEERRPAHVWHCSLSLSADEGQLSDEQWQTIATQFVDRMGFTAESGKAECRWVAVRHGLSKNGNDHVHIAVSLVRADGTKASVHNDFDRAQRVCRELEEEHGLAITGDRAAGLGTRGVDPAVDAGSRARGHVEPDSVALARMVRAAAATSADEAEFVRRARRAGLLIRPRFAQGTTDVVAGYSVALRPRAAAAKPVWFGGGKLARDLTLPRLRADWPDTVEGSTAAIAEWRAAYNGQPPAAPGGEAREPDPELWKQYASDVRELREQLRGVPMDDTATWAVVARESAGVFAAWSQRVEVDGPGPLARVSDELARSAQIRAHQVRPRPTRLVNAGSTALLIAASALRPDSVTAQLMLIRELARVAQAMHDVIAARGDARRAAQMATVIRTQLAAVTATMPAPAAPPTTAAGLAVDEVRRFESGSARPHAAPPSTPTRRPDEGFSPDRAADLDR
ncbi:relaxase/mobilization nuclease domain-containing protein [Leifsonia sp. H3M29-4]|uniref:relaxase/mobilization nuclease domain-containing protein n=1 Tax=Salinibacterium metalliresistens TaxID=3031321 RepID=UPI0023D9F5CC|nr:relaxase/mobilization nuclease domain-containing protein [Salinibacterium metalliresistens]MDF1480335.1 relaxase/mobilization nuclease domain-containing protein [Salinibacterium metalliresistens]